MLGTISSSAQVNGGAIMLADFEANATTYVDSSNFTVRSAISCASVCAERKHARKDPLLR